MYLQTLYTLLINKFTLFNNNNKKILIPLYFIVHFTCAQSDADIQLANEYYAKGEKNKAVELYRNIVKQDNLIPIVHNNYLFALIDLGLFSEGQAYLKRIIQKFPNNINYQADVAWLYMKAGNLQQADKIIKELIEGNKQNASRIKILAEYLSTRSLTEYAIQSLLASRKHYNVQSLFCLELASLYRMRGDKNNMVREYLNYVTQDNYNLQYVKNVLQVLLEPEDMDVLENMLLQHIQSNPDKEVYAELLIWLNIQQKNFYKAFIQAKAYDRRTASMGERTLEVAYIALNNEDFDAAAASFQWIINSFPQGPFHAQARIGLLQTREKALRRLYPVPLDSARSIVAEYHRYISEYLPSSQALEAQRNLAMIYCHWLKDNQKAIQLLKEIIHSPLASKSLVARSKLDLGDVYLLNNEPWESALLYAQVEKALKDSDEAYEARLRSAKLWYFRGDFKLAAQQLDVLKESSSREIANDAMELSLRIKENLALDSSGIALRALSRVELLLQQEDVERAIKILGQIKEGHILLGHDEAIQWSADIPVKEQGDSVWISFTNYGILDDVYWLEADLFIRQGQYEKALECVTNIINQYPTDVLADDAFFKKCEIYHYYLKQTDTARGLYLEFINRFPGSVYVAEARKRFRILRGDFDKTPSN